MDDSVIITLIFAYSKAAIKHIIPVPDQVKRSFVIFDIRACSRSNLSVRVPGCQKLKNVGLTRSGTARMLYSCTHMATVGVKGLKWQNMNGENKKTRSKRCDLPCEFFSDHHRLLIISLQLVLRAPAFNKLQVSEYDTIR